MNLKRILILNWYLPLYNFVAKERIKQNDLDPKIIHIQIATVLSTSTLMWAYTILAYNSMSSPIPGFVGIVCSSIHLASPLLFRITNRYCLAANVLLAAGMIHQGTFTFHSGGFMSFCLIWLGILPIIGGVTCGKKGAVTWLIVSMIVSGWFLSLHLLDFNFPIHLSREGFFWGQLLIVFGWIYLSSVITIVHVALSEEREKILHEQGVKIDDLFRVLFHDLANPLGRMSIGLSIAKKHQEVDNRGLAIAAEATEAMIDITKNVRKMYAVSKGKASVDLSFVSLNSAVKYILEIYQGELKAKNITINYDFEKNEKVHLLVEGVSFNNQVLANLILNAIKFSHPGSKISINTKILEKGLYQIEIKDNGVGIPASLIPHLFDLNKKTSRSGTNGESGTGFGIHIAKSFIEFFGGSIQIDSKEETADSPGWTSIKIFLRGKDLGSQETPK